MLSDLQACRSRRLADGRHTPLALYGDLFVDVQMGQVFADGKTFVDATPVVLAPAALRALYASQKGEPGFSLAGFVALHFHTAPPVLPVQAAPATPAEAPSADLRQHIRALWPRMVRRAEAAFLQPGIDTLLPLPQPYVVPGGRFREVYYWDSYFTMLGLVQDGFADLAQAMLDNFAHLITRYGCVPNANRSYMLSRSQPPFFYKMVTCVAGADVDAALARYLPQLLTEHAYWMDGERGLAPGQASGCVVRLADGHLLNRFWDERDDPREESWRDDVLTAQASDRPAAQVWRDLRAGAASGWDFSSRWCADPQRLHTIETTNLLPIDLNALLWGLERSIAQASSHLGLAAQAQAFNQRATQRRAAINRHLWQAPLGHYVDHHWARAAPLHNLTAATVVPLFVGLASPGQAWAVAHCLDRDLLAANGLLTTPLATGQQWDSPNGWAPLQWMAIHGLRSYGQTALADTITTRWMSAVQRVFAHTGRLLEKYDARQDRPGGGGEYPTQDGFGWTNGTFVAMDGLGV